MTNAETNKTEQLIATVRTFIANCEDLAKLQALVGTLSVEAEKFYAAGENINGIRCEGLANEAKDRHRDLTGENNHPIFGAPSDDWDADEWSTWVD